MRLGKKKQDAAYAAIHAAILDVRIVLNRDGLSDAHDVKIAQLEHAIWRGIVEALDICTRDRQEPSR